ncbi:Gfo/Idh/MocA family oxidoreductase [Chitinophaga sp. MM2321]|uniref:Gfo/Idh/MocA family oxidoreductase n=1 Tax=Chitinophaga sp. MM2321 TaxID=3137178 RepID=UPI0032D59D22
MIKIGMIGMSPGNAHPYSWSAIINGCFKGDEIIRVGYPAVAHYLEANKDTIGISGAKVTHIWTQDKTISQSIAATTHIENIVDNLEDMVGVVDAVILSRDDAQQHVTMSKPFFEAGIPVFIDKPIAVTREDLAWFSDQHEKEKVFMSCSSMRYSNECRIVKQELASLGKLELVTAVGKKDWLKYGVHLLEAVFTLLDDPQPITVQHIGEKDKDIVHVKFENGVQVTFHLFMNISSTFQLSVFGELGWRLIDIRNSYSMFRDNIIEFVRSVEEGQSRLPFSKTESIINTLIGARESFENGGAIIQLKS